ncbi:hypothetical protein DM02DRAFT_614238 [Periconia macrospinosa]|uniref:Uncharacterized protein n=1 Tax=Periconia macrospinosa TaxID=97972 RepID=A0A2V1DQX9_9PLEO|nr:hypothetical protein DM02DRAFT_614238 [Periconia macrospinosa]
MSTESSAPNRPVKDYETPTGAAFQVDFTWSRFRNIVKERKGDSLTPVYIQHFRPLKPQLQIDDAATKTRISTGTINGVSIAAECTIHGQTIGIKPLSKWKTAYNYFSPALSSAELVAVSWITTWSLKTWDFVCVESSTQSPIAKFSVNLWALKEVGNFYFAKSAAELPKELRDEVITVGLTILYVMATRMNNPLNLLGSTFAKAGKVEDGRAGGVELQERPQDGTKHKQV